MTTSPENDGDSGAGDRSTKPYLMRAIYDWAIDCELTPQILVAIDLPEVVVPVEFAKDGQIVLNLHPQSIRDLEMGNEYLMFSARFSGKPFEVIVPIDAILAVYARENGQGIVFQADGSGVTPPPVKTDTDASTPVVPAQNKGKAGGSSHLKLVK